MTTTSPRRIALGSNSRHSGFTLVELLVVVTIIIVLAALSVVGVNRMRFSAAQVTTMNQMKQVATAALTWGSEKNEGEPSYVANGTGDYSNECTPGTNPALAPGNPAILLYNPEDPEQGYITDHRLFFSPLVKRPAPESKDYIPSQVGAEKSWGNFVWYYPFTNNKTAKQKSATSQSLGTTRIANGFENRLMMMVDYSRSEAVWEKIPMALFIDGSVRALGNDETPTRLP